MTDVVITATSVAKGANAITRLGTLGATTTAGQAVYFDSSAGTWKLADGNAVGTAGSDGNIGIALNGGASGQPVEVDIEDDDFTPGGTLAIGTQLYVSETAGGICPAADVGAGVFVTLLMVPISTSKAILKPIPSGVAVAA